MDYLNYLLQILSTSGQEIGQFFQGVWSYGQYGSAGVGVALLLARKIQIFILYAFGFYYLWGFPKVINAMDFQDPSSWIHLLTYLIFGLVVFFTLCYYFFIRPKELKN